MKRQLESFLFSLDICVGMLWSAYWTISVCKPMKKKLIIFVLKRWNAWKTVLKYREWLTRKKLRNTNYLIGFLYTIKSKL